ncbi:MAG: hypothetical protein R2789_00415 [Microthrixaceae bacterium]
MPDDVVVHVLPTGAEEPRPPTCANSATATSVVPVTRSRGREAACAAYLEMHSHGGGPPGSDTGPGEENR